MQFKSEITKFKMFYINNFTFNNSCQQHVWYVGIKFSVET